MKQAARPTTESSLALSHSLFRSLALSLSAQVFFLARQDGRLDVWDYFYRMNEAAKGIWLGSEVPPKAISQRLFCRLLDRRQTKTSSHNIRTIYLRRVIACPKAGPCSDHNTKPLGACHIHHLSIRSLLIKQHVPPQARGLLLAGHGKDPES